MREADRWSERYDYRGQRRGQMSGQSCANGDLAASGRCRRANSRPVMYQPTALDDPPRLSSLATSLTLSQHYS